MDKLRKQIIKDEGLSITIETNLKETDFLDVTFNVVNKIYKPYRKPGNSPLYINIHSNHSESILKTMPDMINRRMCDTSCNEMVFHEAKGEYEAALTASGLLVRRILTKHQKPKEIVLETLYGSIHRIVVT